jgi:[glutamine synthetase] adenylyltransferase / [glutamine synthetase]-adenylyl-L-tyrosine phosphorylase
MRPAFSAQRAALESLVRRSCSASTSTSSAIASLRDLHEQIRAQTRAKSARRAGGVDDARRQRQARPRRHPRDRVHRADAAGDPRRPRARLRDRATLPTLATLAEFGCCLRPRARGWPAHYVFLRRLEHALQYVDDAQTHQLPAGRRRWPTWRRCSG